MDLSFAARVGFKADGSERSAEEAAAYLALVDEIMGEDWVNAHHCYFGDSSLLGGLADGCWDKNHRLAPMGNKP